MIIMQMRHLRSPHPGESWICYLQFLLQLQLSTKLFDNTPCGSKDDYKTASQVLLHQPLTKMLFLSPCVIFPPPKLHMCKCETCIQWNRDITIYQGTGKITFFVISGYRYKRIPGITTLEKTINRYIRVEVINF